MCVELSHRDDRLSGALLCGFVCHGFSRYLLLEDKISPQSLSTGFISLSDVHFTVAAFSHSLLRDLEEQNNKTERESKQARKRKILSNTVKVILDEGQGLFRQQNIVLALVRLQNLVSPEARKQQTLEEIL